MSEPRDPADAPDPEVTAGEPPAGEPAAGEPAEEESATGFVQVRRRRAPRFRAFVGTGLVLAFLVSAVVAVLTPPSGGYSQQALFGFLFVALGMVGCLLGGLVAVLADRRTGRR